MNRHYVFIRVGEGLWLLALIIWFFGGGGAVVTGGMALCLLVIFFREQQRAVMFGKRKTRVSDMPDNRGGRPCTVIAPDICMKGELHVTGLTYIYGEVCGNIMAGCSDGQICIMPGGQVSGDISCGKLVINGTVNGKCRAEDICIGESGNVNGSLIYDRLSVIPGGIFTGVADMIGGYPGEKSVGEYSPAEITSLVVDDE